MKYLYSIILLLLFFSLTYAKGKYHEVIFSTESKYICDACLSADGETIICTDNNNLKAFSAKSKEILGNFIGGHRNNILSVAMSADNSKLASGGSDSTIVIWDYNSHKIIQRITYATGKITCIKFSPDNQYILFGCSNSKAYLYNIKEQKMAFEFTDQKKDVTSVAFSYYGNLIAIAGGDKIIRIYNTADFQLKSVLKAHTNWVRSVCFYNYGLNLISVGDDKKMIQWNLSKSNYRKKTVNKDWVLCVDIENKSIDKNNLYVLGTMNGSIRINYSFGWYDARLNSPISKLIILPNESESIEIIVATLGTGLLYLNAANIDMNMTK